VRFEMILRAGWFRAPFVYANPSTWDGFWYVTGGQQFHDWLTDPLANWSKRISDLMAMAAGQLGLSRLSSSWHSPSRRSAGRVTRS